jgi:hypothetical protein
MASKRIHPLETWVGNKLQERGVSKYHAARHRKTIIGDPKFQAIDAKHGPKIYKAVRAFTERYNNGMQGMRMNKREYRVHLLRWSPREVQKFDRLNRKLGETNARLWNERERFIDRYVTANFED